MSSRPRVTVVNDSPEFLEVIGDVLAECYQPTLITGSLASVMAAVCRSQPAVLIVETSPPGDPWNGGTLPAVRAEPELRSVPLLLCTPVLSGDASAEMLRTLRPAGVLELPFTPGGLTGAIDQLLREASAHRSPAPSRDRTPQSFAPAS